jgi:eukaryotic-like serine/threonine-protein kinase
MDQGSGGPASAQVVGDRTGTLVCGWRLERSLGGGPICESWFAGRAGSKSAVLRILRQPLATRAAARAAWVAASWAANRFYHPRVPRVLQDGADHGGAPVVVRGWAKGAPLDHVVRTACMDSKLVLRLAEQLLDTLEMAHAHGIVHGAVAPSNVIVTPQGTVRLVDFATTPDPGDRAADELFRARVLASPFAAPERRASEQSDVWSVGACLHFAIAGCPPSSDPSLRRAAPDADAALAALVDRALAVDPRERYESAHVMLGDVRRMMAGRPSLAPFLAAPSPSQAPAARSVPPSPAPPSGREGAADADFAGAMAALAPSAASSIRPIAWRGNMLLFAAIAVIVAIAAWVMVHGRRPERPSPPPALAVPREHMGAQLSPRLIWYERIFL